ncbi:hypothetical protein Anas_02411 [Armadillidium nasatum]|uniref:Uncharacterized protein n=1 Tax=Armadillidium nasatum TaxID=96803 RepID=A0A5N5TEW6_9CRUS|nr:hypothetical protein Anas_02411 [Armadillidium nasatum]
MTSFETIIILLTLWTQALSLPFRSFSPRSVPGRLRVSSDPDSIKDYLNNYLEMFKQHQLRNRQYPYTIPEYEPVYQQGYLSRRPEINDEGTWYDDITPPEQVSAGIDERDNNNQEAALLQLFLDHLAGKYSLEDLETIERQAAIEDNTEYQLQSLMPHKKSRYPIMGSRSVPRKFLDVSERQGQKEEAFMVPASSVRKPVFLRNIPNPQKVQTNLLPTKVTTVTKTTPVHDEKVVNKNEKVTKVPNLEVTSSTPATPSADTTDSLKSASTTMEPGIKSAYEAFLAYLDQERFLRKTADEAKHFPQKRFVSDQKSLTQQLASLKKTVT